MTFFTPATNSQRKSAKAVILNWWDESQLVGIEPTLGYLKHLKSRELEARASKDSKVIPFGGKFLFYGTEPLFPTIPSMWGRASKDFKESSFWWR